MAVPRTQEGVLYLYQVLVLIRTFEEKVAELFRGGTIYGHVHLYIGQEAVATGVMSVLKPRDRITSTHRGHGHLIAKGARMDRAMAELFGRADGYCAGKGESMHIADVGRGMLGANAVVAAGVPVAVGSALSQQVLADEGVTVAFFGDGGSSQGLVHEVMNLASI
jgi:pyruvate dehydrogenase E1 component alpha subunit